MGRYAEAGVNFENEHNIVGKMIAAGVQTFSNLDDLKELGIELPSGGQDFSGSLKMNLELMVENGIKKIVLTGGVDGPGSKPIVQQIYQSREIYKMKEGDKLDPVKLGCPAHDSIAMCVNDVLCAGARPVLIFEYHAWQNTDDPTNAGYLADGKVLAASQSLAAIVGGENASLGQMITGAVPRMGYDMNNTVVGLITDQELVDNPLGSGRVKEGDAVIGLSSSGLHCNGITLVWKTGMAYHDSGFGAMETLNKYNEELGESVSEAILTPTTIYVKPVLEVIDDFGRYIHAVANITGEGVANMRRVLPEGNGLELDYTPRDVRYPHPIFEWVQEHGEVSTREMYEAYNMGTGMVMVVDADKKDHICSELIRRSQNSGLYFTAYPLGKVVKADKSIAIKAYDGSKHVYER